MTKVKICGITRAEDAELAIAHGAAGVVVSNHGGRQLDGAPSSIAALPEIVDSVAAQTEVMFDGGIRTGLDVLAALALGARGVFLGRSPLHALAVGGARGVEHLFTDLATELGEILHLAGCASPYDAPTLLPEWLLRPADLR